MMTGQHGTAFAQHARPTAILFDEYEYVNREDEAPRLARFAKELKRQPKARAFVIGYADRLFRYGDLNGRQRAGYSGSRLIYRRDDALDEDRLVVVDGGFREKEMLELYLVPPGAPAPTPRPTIRFTDVTFCPQVTVSGPLYVWERGQPLQFSASVREERTQTKPSYRWTVSAGEMISGQDTTEITVRWPNSEYQQVKATVEVGGYASECNASASGTSPEKMISVPFKFDEFGQITCEDIKARLDNFGISLQSHPEMRAHIIYYGGQYYTDYRERRHLPTRGQAEAFGSLLKNYLINVRGISPNKLVLVNGGFRSEWGAELWLAPSGASAPVPTPTIPANKIKYRRGKLNMDLFIGCDEGT
ncbi:MAG: hypothetical protein M3407_05785 [Acidobacteriota bacterium]|nr:hypothetical protein [Acidobacteriota bacterium]